MFALGVGAGIGLSLMMGHNTAEITVPENNDVLGAQSGCCSMDTEKGSIDFHCGILPDVLPLCIDQAYLDTIKLCFKVVGGYEPIDGYIDLYQKREYKGRILVTWDNWASGYCWEYWRPIFSLEEGVCKIKLDSNQWPCGADPVIGDPCTIPGKEVCVKWWSLWQGCTDEEQQFTLIQTQKSDVFRAPNSE